MNPIKKNVLFEETAKELGLPVSVVSEIVSFYYKNVQEKLSSAEFLSVSLPNLGTFEIQKRRLSTKIAKSKSYIEKHDGETTSMAVFSNKINFKKDLEKFENLVTKLEELDEQKKETKKSRQNFKNKE